MHGIMLHRLGSSVRILEQSTTDTPISHMAGVCLGPDVLEFFKRFDRVPEIPLGIPAVQLQSLDRQGKVHPFMQINRVMSSWDALYHRLRANFDMRVSEYVSCPPGVIPQAGETAENARSRASYEVGKQVVAIEQLKTKKLLVHYKDHAEGGKDVQAQADLVLGADGPNSAVRQMFLNPSQAERKYSGYVAWRGVVPENQVSEETRAVFQANITYSIFNDKGGHVIL